MFFVYIIATGGKQDKDDFFQRAVFFQKLAGCIHCDSAGFLDGITINAATNGRERDGSNIVFNGEFQTVRITK